MSNSKEQMEETIRQSFNGGQKYVTGCEGHSSITKLNTIETLSSKFVRHGNLGFDQHMPQNYTI